MKAKSALLIICFFGILVSCTEKGCKDKSALNYQVTANVDDGSCVYCNTIEVDKGKLTTSIFDNRGGSIHLNDQILSIEASQSSEVYNDGGCGQNGCYMTLKITNLIPENISGLNFSIDFTSSSGVTFTQHYFQAMIVSSGETLIKPNIFFMPVSNCPSIENGAANGRLYDASYF